MWQRYWPKLTLTPFASSGDEIVLPAALNWVDSSDRRNSGQLKSYICVIKLSRPGHPRTFLGEKLKRSSTVRR